MVEMRGFYLLRTFQATVTIQSQPWHDCPFLFLRHRGQSQGCLAVGDGFSLVFGRLCFSQGGGGRDSPVRGSQLCEGVGVSRRGATKGSSLVAAPEGAEPCRREGWNR